jgi:hypothetical protein
LCQEHRLRSALMHSLLRTPATLSIFSLAVPSGKLYASLLGNK